ncbi:MAG: MBOAT family protein [Ignavibacteriales bacterium]|nr:MBOAT family protein [Ignavibacteriales bacterium]
MLFNFDISKFLNLFVYNPKDPLLFTTGLFLFLFSFVLLIFVLIRKNKNLRVVFLLLFSLFFYYKISGLFFLLLIGTAVVNFLLGKWLFLFSDTLKRRLILILAVIVNLFLLGYFKYTNFFIQVINDLSSKNIDALDILVPIGISFYTFKSLNYIFDLYLEKIEPETNFLNFALFVSFFPNLLAGPIDRAEKFLPQINKEVFISREDIGKAIFLICSGLFKKAVIADYISLNFVDRVMDEPLRFTGVENLMATYGYALQIYCDFSGYSDIAIGLALLLGFKLMDNFNSPYKASSVAEFWRRWHISLSSWLLDYIFKPLQFSLRNLRLLGNALAILITFVACGLWHGANWTFIVWGTIHGLLMAVSFFTRNPRTFIWKKLGLSNTKILHVIQVFITFNLIAFAWVFFRAVSIQSALDVFSQIINFFHEEVFVQFIQGYPVISALILGGFILHFLPAKVELKTVELISKTPLIGKAIILAFFIWLAIQVRSADLQPFIYFQF